MTPWRAALLAFCALGIAVSAPIQPAAAITAELAKKCRALAIKAHPTRPAGGKSSFEQAQRDYFKACVAKNGNMPDEAPPASQAPATR
jgi:hypothetical protein